MFSTSDVSNNVEMVSSSGNSVEVTSGRIGPFSRRTRNMIVDRLQGMTEELPALEQELEDSGSELEEDGSRRRFFRFLI